MIEKVNPGHPDKLADRIAGAIVDLAYEKEDDPRIAVEVLIGHGQCHVIIESSVKLDPTPIINIIHRIGGDVKSDIRLVPQDAHLSRNQERGLRCGDNGIFKGVPLTEEQKKLSPHPLTDAGTHIFKLPLRRQSRHSTGQPAHVQGQPPLPPC